jgi:hypothetical protein
MAMAGGLPSTVDGHHAMRMAQFVLGVLRIVAHVNETLGTDFVVRVGMNTGPVVTGVIGTQKVREGKLTIQRCVRHAHSLMHMHTLIRTCRGRRGACLHSVASERPHDGGGREGGRSLRLMYGATRSMWPRAWTLPACPDASSARGPYTRCVRGSSILSPARKSACKYVCVCVHERLDACFGQTCLFTRPMVLCRRVYLTSRLPPLAAAEGLVSV